MNKVCIALLGIMMAAAAVPAAESQTLGGTLAPAVCAAGLGAGGAAAGIVCETLANDGIVRDAWEFTGTAGQTVHYFIDNVDSDVDLRARVCATVTGSTCSLFGDDETECTVEPAGGYACPEETGALPADVDGDGKYYLIVGAWSDPFYSGPFPHSYSGSIDTAGAPVPVTLVTDDDA